jgi:CubicO group peptidase (beta-lactamase class C family)
MQLQLAGRIRDFLEAKMKAGYFTGASVTFGRFDGEQVNVHVGRLSKKVETPVNSKTVFDLQSMTKALVTAPLFFALAREGQLAATSRVLSHLPTPHPRLEGKAADATLFHLLTHSAGFSDQDMTGDFKTAYELWERIFTAPRHYEPGEKIEYADGAFRVLGKVIESVTQESLASLSQRLLFQKLLAREIGFHPLNPFNVIGCPEAHGTIDDDHVRLLGGVVGCDGLFASSETLFEYTRLLAQGHPAIGEPLGPALLRNVFSPPAKIESFFDAMSVGPKTYGWEVNPAGFSYAGHFKSPTTFEKSGGAGTFIWFDQARQVICVYLTNYGKPKPFGERKWNRLIDALEPHVLSTLIHESLS